MDILVISNLLLLHTGHQLIVSYAYEGIFLEINSH